MISDKDAYGHIIWNYFRGLTSFDVVERDDGYVNADEGASAYFADYKEWKSHERKAIKYAKGRCLDIGCAAGRVLLYLQQKGLKPIGIDISPLAIKVCRLRGAKSAKLMGIDEIGKFKPGSFDTIILFGYNFGLFENNEKAKRLLLSMGKITSRNAVIIAESRDPYITDNPVHFEYHAMNRRKGRLPGQLRLRVRFMQYATDWHDYLYVSKKEMKDILSGTGWEVKKFIDSEQHEKNGRYIAIIQKIWLQT